MSGAVTTKDENIDENDSYFHINWEKILIFKRNLDLCFHCQAVVGVENFLDLIGILQGNGDVVL